jgi:hypothetical protein
VDESKWVSLTDALGCQLGKLPFTYLGLPLGTTRLSFQDFTPILTRMERHLMGISRFPIHDGRLILVNSVYSALPTFYMCSLKLPFELLDRIDKYRKHVLWHGGDVNKKGGYLVSWKHACRSKADGGLGIIDLRIHNSTLLMKFMHKFYNRADLPWVELIWTHLYKNSRPPHERKNAGSFWWRDIMSLAPKFLQMSRCKVKAGFSISFWCGH